METPMHLYTKSCFINPINFQAVLCFSQLYSCLAATSNKDRFPQPCSSGLSALYDQVDGMGPTMTLHCNFMHEGASVVNDLPHRGSVSEVVQKHYSIAPGYNKKEWKIFTKWTPWEMCYRSLPRTHQ